MNTPPWNHQGRPKLDRRAFLNRFGMGLGAVALADLVNPAGAQGASDGVLNSLHYPPKAKRVIFLFQAGALFDSLTVAENIIFPFRQQRKILKWDEMNHLAQDKLAMVGLDGFQNYYPANLSGGQQKRVALARAIAMDPEVMLYDEPTTGLDPIRSDIINELVLKLKREIDVTSVVVTHDMKSAYKIADRIIMLHNGKIVADGTADDIRLHPHPAVQQFINGQASEEDLAVLRMHGSVSRPQFEPEDFEG